jgi:hypothetical protein
VARRYANVAKIHHAQMLLVLSVMDLHLFLKGFLITKCDFLIGLLVLLAFSSQAFTYSESSIFTA